MTKNEKLRLQFTDVFFIYFQCMPETWYSAVDMQLFVLSPVFVYPLWRWPKETGPIVTVSGIFGALWYTMVIYVKWNLPLFFLPTRRYVIRFTQQWIIQLKSKELRKKIPLTLYFLKYFRLF